MDNDKIQETSESGENSNAGVPPTSSDRARLFRTVAISLAAAAAVVVGVILLLEIIDRPPERKPSPQEVASALGFKIDREGRSIAEEAKTVEDQKKAEQKYKEALAIFDGCNDQGGKAETYNDLGILYSYWKRPSDDRFAEAVECYEKSLEIKVKSEWYWGQGNTLTNMGNLYSIKRQYDSAVEHMERAVKAYELARNMKHVAIARTGLAFTYYQAGQLPKAKECFQKCLEEARTNKNLDDEPRILGMLGSICVDQNQKAEASKYFEETLEVSRKVGNMEEQKLALISLGAIYERDGNNKAALECYEKASEMSVSNEDPETTLCAMESTARLYYITHQYPRAAEWSMKVIELANKLKIPETEKKLRPILQYIYNKWSEIDPDNSELKRIKSVLDQGAK